MKKYIVSAAIALFSTASFAQEFIGEFKNWGVFTTVQENKKVCYMTSIPAGKTGNFRKRGEPYVLVTLRTGGTSEVSVNSGFPYKENSEVNFKVKGKGDYKFFTSAQTPQMAWAKDASTDTSAIEAMKKGSSVIVRGTSKIGTFAEDTYRLNGFTAAFNKMKETCK